MNTLHCHTAKTLFQRPDQVRHPLYVVTPVINSRRFRTRWKLYEDFAKHVSDSGGILYTVEVAFGDREFAVTQSDNPRHLQLRTFHELWLKEQAINLMVQRLPCDWQFVAWVDADCHFARPDWCNETIHTLQNYPIIQMWSQLVDLSPDFEINSHMQSFMDVQLNGARELGYCYGGKKILKHKFGSPGLAWAARREAWNQMGGLIDYTILGAGDWYFANAAMGTLDNAVKTRNDLTGPFIQKMLQYQEHLKRAYWEGRSIVGNVGLMKGLVSHYWHGPRSNRGYNTRGEILMKHNFDPERDLVKDWQGLYQVSNRAPGLRRDIQKYFSQRSEDAI
jgi:hypothetical protein